MRFFKKIRINKGTWYFQWTIVFLEYQVPFWLKQKFNNNEKTGSSIGIDVGLKDFATLSDGKVYANPKFFRTLAEKLAKAQRILSRRQIGSSNWHKQKIKVARLHEKIVNARTDFSVKNMLKNHNLAKAISEVSW